MKSMTHGGGGSAARRRRRRRRRSSSAGRARHPARPRQGEQRDRVRPRRIYRLDAIGTIQRTRDKKIQVHIRGIWDSEHVNQNTTSGDPNDLQGHLGLLAAGLIGWRTKSSASISAPTRSRWRSWRRVSASRSSSGCTSARFCPPIEGETRADARGAHASPSSSPRSSSQPEMFATSLGGEATLRLLTMPFSDPKKIEQVLGYELESQILGELEGLVYDSVISTTRVGEAGTSTTNVIAVAAPKEVGARARRGAVGHRRRAARRRRGGAVVRGAARARVRRRRAARAPQTQIIDFGHRHTNVCVVRDEHGAVRALDPARRRGRHRRHRRAVPHDRPRTRSRPSTRRRSWPRRAARSPSPAHQQGRRHRARGAAAAHARAQADAGRLSRGRRGRRPIACSSPAARRGCTGSSSTSRSSSACRRRGSSLIADDPFLDPAMAERARDGRRRVAALELPAQALGLALAAAAPVPQVNLRKAELSYRTDYSYLRGKAGYLAAAVLAILAFAAINAAASLRGLRKEGEALETRLRKQTTELFGEPTTDGKAVSEELRGGPKGGAPPVPTMTAYDRARRDLAPRARGRQGKARYHRARHQAEENLYQGHRRERGAGRRAASTSWRRSTASRTSRRARSRR